MLLRMFTGLTLVMMLPLTASATLAPVAHPMRAMTALRACTSSQLRAAVTSDEGAMMHRELRVTLTNSGAMACTIDGFPAIRLLDAHHHVTTAEESFSGTPRGFALPPGKSASFGLRIATGDGSMTYPMVPAFAVIPPGDVVALVVQHPVPAGPTVDVQAIVAGP
jgi:hypothetical protein